MLPAMMMGAQGCIDGPPCMAPEPWVALGKAIAEGDVPKAKQLQELCNKIVDLVVTPEGYQQPAVQKMILSERLGERSAAHVHTLIRICPSYPLHPVMIGQVCHMDSQGYQRCHCRRLARMKYWRGRRRSVSAQWQVSRRCQSCKGCVELN